MYSREFSDSFRGLPPQYGGTAFRKARHEMPPREEREKQEECEERENRPPRRESTPPPERKDCPCEDSPPKKTTCRERPDLCEGDGGSLSGLLGKFLPAGIEAEDLLLLGIALLLLADGCEDSYIPMILLFLLIIH